MPYKFTFDLSKVPRFFFSEIAMVSYQKGMHKAVLTKLHELILKFKIQEATGLNLADAVVLLQDLIDLQAVNIIERNKFIHTKKRALFCHIALANTWTADVKPNLMQTYSFLCMFSLLA